MCLTIAPIIMTLNALKPTHRFVPNKVAIDTIKVAGANEI